MNTSRLFIALVIAGVATFSSVTSQAKQQTPPNVLVIMADDLGYSDIGCYGGEIDTPQPRFPCCERAALLTVLQHREVPLFPCPLCSLSQYCVAAGDVSLSHAVTSAEVLRDAGYFTAMTGKWHLKREPTDFGVRALFRTPAAAPVISSKATTRSGLMASSGTSPAVLNDKTFYTTVADVDFAIDFLSEARKKEKPFYLYVAFNAPHAPLHALPEDYAKYKGRYTEGWDEIRDSRIKKTDSVGASPRYAYAQPTPTSCPGLERRCSVAARLRNEPAWSHSLP